VLAEPAIVRHCPDTVVALEQHDQAAVLELESGTRLRAGFAIAADGGDSRLRELAGIGASRKDYGQRGVVAYVDTAEPHAETAWQRFLPTGPLAFLPCAD